MHIKNKSGMSKTLSDSEIKGLYFYTKVQNIPYEDVQHEIVDHLATAVESQSNPNDSFRKRLKNYSDTLPKQFFSDFEKQHRRSLTKLWWSRFWKGFTFKTIIISILSSSFLYVLLKKTFPFFNDFFSDNLFLISFLAFQCFVQYLSLKRLRKIDYSKQLITFHYASMVTIIFCAVSPFLLLLINFQMKHYPMYNLSGILLISFLLASTYILSFVLPKQLYSDIENKYKHLKIKLS